MERAEGGLSLEEYLEACMTAGGVANAGSEEGEDEEMAEWAASDEEEASAERAGPAGMDVDSAAAAEGGEDLLWEGSLVVSGKVCPTIASYLGGERMPIETWPMMVDVKGRVKMGDFRGFLQSPQLSRHRIVMVIGLKSLDDGPAAPNPLAVAAATYREAHRVGFAEPRPGVEVYLGHPAAAPLTALLPQEGKRGGSQDLLAVVVKKRLPTKPTPPAEEAPQQASAQPQQDARGGVPPASQPREGPGQDRGEEVWSPPTSPFETPGLQAWQAKPGRPHESGPPEATEAVLQEQVRLQGF
jgi:hypothetical protein